MLRGRRKTRLYVLEGLTITVDTTAAYGSISGDSGRVDCDRFVHGDSNSNIRKFSSSSRGASCDLDDHVAHGDLNRFDNSSGVGNEMVIRAVLVTWLELEVNGKIQARLVHKVVILVSKV